MRRTAVLIAAFVLASCGAAAGTNSSGPGTAAPGASPVVTLPPGASGAALPSGGISREQAIEMASMAAGAAFVFVSAEAGRFGDLNTEPNASPGDWVPKDRWVWALTFAGRVRTCPEEVIGGPPDITPCPTFDAGAFVEGTETQYLDYFTGENLTVLTNFPPF
jgi:hypothetical protein